MGKRGPRKTPAEIKILAGTYRKNEDGPVGDQPRTELLDKLPPLPEVLGRNGKRLWESQGKLLIDAGVLNRGDLEAFTTYCRCADEITKCDEAIKQDGEYVSTAAGGIRAHPAHNVRFQWLAKMGRLEQEFGLTPSARTAIKVERKHKQGIVPRRRA